MQDSCSSVRDSGARGCPSGVNGTAVSGNEASCRAVYADAPLNTLAVVPMPTEGVHAGRALRVLGRRWGGWVGGWVVGGGGGGGARAAPHLGVAAVALAMEAACQPARVRQQRWQRGNVGSRLACCAEPCDALACEAHCSPRRSVLVCPSLQATTITSLIRARTRRRFVPPPPLMLRLVLLMPMPLLLLWLLEGEEAQAGTRGWGAAPQGSFRRAARLAALSLPLALTSLALLPPFACLPSDQQGLLLHLQLLQLHPGVQPGGE